MALLQISEPGQSTEPHQHRLAVGIDLGTTNSLVATVRNGVAVVLPDEHGRGLLPSIVRYLPQDDVQVGYEAEAKQAEDPKYRALCEKYLARMTEHQTEIESYATSIGAEGPGSIKKAVGAG